MSINISEQFSSFMIYYLLLIFIGGCGSIENKEHEYTVPLSGCIVDSRIIAAKDGYNSAMNQLLQKKFEQDIVAEAIKYEEEVDNHAPLIEDFGLARVIVFTVLVIPNKVEKFTVELRPNESINVTRQTDGDWKVASTSREIPETTYRIDDDNVLINGKEREIQLNISSLFQHKNIQQIKKMKAMNVYGKRNNAIKVNIEKQKHSIILNSGHKKPIKVYWQK